MTTERRPTPEERWERAGLSDSFIFYKVMTEHPDACRCLLERLLHIRLGKVEIAGERTFGADIRSKGIRLDVYARDGKRIFDVELQVRNTRELPERARYYQGVLDVDCLKSGQPYRELRETHVIFICMEDVFGRGLASYTFENICMEDMTLRLGDRSIKHFFAARNYDKIAENAELRALLKLLKSGVAEDDYTTELVQYTAEAKRSTQTRRQYMEWERQRFYDFEDGFSDGTAAGAHDAKIKMTQNLLKNGKLSDSEICEMTGLTSDEVERIKEQLSVRM